MNIVCYSLKQKKSQTDEVDYIEDHFQVFETIELAKKFYKDLLKYDDELYSATLCKPIESTEPHYLEV